MNAEVFERWTAMVGQARKRVRTKRWLRLFVYPLLVTLIYGVLIWFGGETEFLWFLPVVFAVVASLCLVLLPSMVEGATLYFHYEEQTPYVSVDETGAVCRPLLRVEMRYHVVFGLVVQLHFREGEASDEKRFTLPVPKVGSVVNESLHNRPYFFALRVPDAHPWEWNFALEADAERMRALLLYAKTGQKDRP